MQEMINDESQNDEAAHQHGAGSVGGTHGMVLGVCDGARGEVVAGKGSGGPDVQEDHEQEEDTHGPEELDVSLQEGAVAVEGFRAEEYLEIAGEMADHEQEQDESRDGHDVLPAQRRAKNVRNHLH